MFKENLLSGRRILVTGGGTGLGKAMASRFLQLGAEVHICGRRKIVCDETAAELGYWLGVDHWGLGFGTEAARAVIDYFFEEFDLDQLIAGARVVNPSSRNILEKCGFQWSGVELHRFEALGSSSPVDAFRLSRGVWASLKSWNNSTRRRS